MRILHELNQLEMGGAERIVQSIIMHDDNNEHTVYSYKDGPMKKPLESSGAKVIIEDGKTEIDIDTDIIHIHTGGDVSKIATAVDGQIPVIETIHSPVVSAVRDEFVTVRVGVSGTITKLNRKCRTIWNGVNIKRLNLLGPSFAICKGTVGYAAGVKVTEEVKEYTSCRGYHKIPSNAFVIGRLGRLGYDKCLEEFLVTCHEVQKMDFGKDVHVLIVGDSASNSHGYLAKLKVMVASLPVKNVHFLPAITEVGWAYEAMDLFLYPSPGEGFCLVIAEAMACGVPVVTWETPLTKELFDGCAILTEHSIEALKRNVVFLMTHEAIRDSFAGMGEERAHADYVSEIMSQKYQDLYIEINSEKEKSECKDTTPSSP